MAATILTLSPFNTPTWEPKVGDLVENFGQIARVLDSDPQRGLTLREVGGRAKWLADPTKCRPVL
jgi:hypothetical protein